MTGLSCLAGARGVQDVDMAAHGHPKASALLSLLFFAFLLFPGVPSLPGPGMRELGIDLQALEVADINPGPHELLGTTSCLSEYHRLDLREEQREVCVCVRGWGGNAGATEGPQGMRGAEVTTQRSSASSLTSWSFSLCRDGRPSQCIWDTRQCMLKRGTFWVNWDKFLALLYASLGPVDASSILRPWSQLSLSPVFLIMCPQTTCIKVTWDPCYKGRFLPGLSSK